MAIRKRTKCDVFERTLTGYNDGSPVYRYTRMFGVSQVLTLSEASSIAWPDSSRPVPENMYLKFKNSTRYYSLARLVLNRQATKFDANNTQYDESALDGL